MPIATEYPATVAELLAIVKQAAATGRRVKAIGRSHARNDMGSTDGVRIVLGRYHRVLAVDRPRRQVTVQAGMPLGHLSRDLAGWGLQLDDVWGRPGQTVGGALSTGTRGLAGRVIGLELITADGSLVSCSAREEPEIFDAARVGLGALGIISTVTVQCGPGFNLRSTTDVAGLDTVLERFDDYFGENDHVQFCWIAPTGVVLVNRRNRTDDPPGRFTRSYVDRGFRVPPGPRHLREAAIEYSIDRSVAVTTLRRVRELVARSRWAPPFPIIVGLAEADNLALSPTAGRPSAYIGGPELPGLEALMGEVGGRPDWGRVHLETAATLRPRYPKWDAWQAVRRRLDPGGLFANDYTDRVLG